MLLQDQTASAREEINKSCNNINKDPKKNLNHLYKEDGSFSLHCLLEIS